MVWIYFFTVIGLLSVALYALSLAFSWVVDQVLPDAPPDVLSPPSPRAGLRPRAAGDEMLAVRESLDGDRDDDWERQARALRRIRR